MSTLNEPLHIGISGSYGGMNLGDEAILEGILGELRATLPAVVTVFSHNPDDTRVRHEVERVIAPRMLTRREIADEIASLDAFILGGGGLFYDGGAELYLRDLAVAQELGIPVMLYAISAGPLVTQTARRAVRETLNTTPAPVITVRDRLGYRLLEDVGVTGDIHLTADPAFLLEPETFSEEALKSEGVELDRHLVGFSVREPGPAAPDIDPEHYYALLAHAADFVIERHNVEVVFVPMETTDVQHSHAVVGHMQNAEGAAILRRRYSPRQVLDLMGRFDFAVGMRLHFLIFAVLRGTPFAALPYASKVRGLLQDLEMPAPPLETVGIGQLIATIDRAWDSRDTIRSTIRAHRPALQLRAQETNAFLLRLLKERLPGRAAAIHPQTRRTGTEQDARPSP